MPADGRIEVMFSFGASSRRTNIDGDNACDVRSHSFVLGVREQGYCLEHFGAPHYVAIRFRAGGMAAFMRQHIGEMTGIYAELDCIWDKSAVRRLESRLFDAPTPQQQVQVIEDFLLRQLQPPSHLPAIMTALKHLEHHHQQVRMTALADELSMSQKHLERLFTRYVGLRPNLFARVIRFQQVMYHAMRRRGASWAQLAIDSGYYDQAHFNKDFKQFVGLPPRDFLAMSHDFIQISTPPKLVEFLQDTPQ
jgi:AraC-like DNA-binding protein